MSCSSSRDRQKSESSESVSESVVSSLRRMLYTDRSSACGGRAGGRACGGREVEGMEGGRLRVSREGGRGLQGREGVTGKN